MSRTVIAALLVVSLLCLADSVCAQPAAAPAAKTGFTDVSRESGAADVLDAHYGYWDPIMSKGKKPGDEYTIWWMSGFTLVDLDGDGDLDLHLAGHGQYATAAYNDGKGRFTAVDAKPDIPRGVRKTQELTIPGGEIRLVYDLNEDGKPDLLISYGDNAGVVYLNDSKGGNPPVWSFKPADVGLDAFSRGVAFVDLNRDGIVDYLYTTDENRRNELSTLHIFYGKGQGRWEKGSELKVLREAGAIPVDVNGDGLVDLLASQRGYTASKRWVLLNDGKGGFTRAVDNGLPEVGSIMGPGDVDQDGDLDLICIEAPDGNTIRRYLPALYINDGKGNFTRKDLPNVRAPRTGNWGGAVVTDFNNDGIADIAVNGRNFLYYLRGLGGGEFESANRAWGLPDSIGPSVDEGLCFGDIDGDGDLDVVTYVAGKDAGHKGIGVFRNDLPKQHWLNVRLVGKKGNQAAAGSIIRVLEPGTDKLLWHEQVAIWGRQSFHSYYFQTRTERHFGLGGRATVDVTVTFYPSGRKVEKKGVAADTTIEVREE